MKKLFALFLTIVLAASLFSFVFAVPAYADNVYNVTCGTYYETICEVDFASQGKPDIISLEIDGNESTGELQQGLKLEYSGTKYYVKGTPMEEGERFIAFNVNFSDGSAEKQYMTIKSARGSRDASRNVDCKMGEAFSLNIYDAIGTLSAFNATWNGLTLQTSGSVLVLSGTPAEAGSFTFSGSVVDAGVIDVKFSIAVNAAVDAVKITKSPSHETCEEGASALFISAAENYSKFEWRVVTPDGNNCWRNEDEIESRFPGVEVNIYTGDDGREYLALSRIPYSMDGMYIQTKFWSKDDKNFELTDAHSALLSVERANLEPARITANPANASLRPGQTTQLKVTASSPDGNTLKYQWYRNSSESTTGGSAIQGATMPTYTPLQEIGTVYYYCSVTNTNGDRSATPAYSSVANVTYAEAEEEPLPPVPQAPKTEPSSAPAEAPAQDKEPEPTPTVQPVREKEKKDSSFILALGIVVAVALGCGSVIYITMRKR